LRGKGYVSYIIASIFSGIRQAVDGSAGSVGPAIYIYIYNLMLIMMLIVSCFCLGRDTYCLSLLCGVSIGFVIMVLRLQAAKYWFRVSVFFFSKSLICLFHAAVIVVGRPIGTFNGAMEAVLH